jgi:hypothetical protein
VCALSAFGVLATPAYADETPDQLADTYLFDSSIREFAAAKALHEHDDVLDWTDNGCSVPGKQVWRSSPGGFNFLPSCQRHDFGYRNYQKQGRFTEDNRQRIDDNFKSDLNAECNKSRGIWAWRGVECRQYANAYYQMVRAFGEP